MFTRIAAASGAATIALASAAFSEQHMTPGTEADQLSGSVSTESMGNLDRVSELTDGDVYTLNAEMDDAEWGTVGYYNDVGAEWDQIGNVTDVVLSPDGNMAGLVVETGGFLDIGDSHVILTSDDYRMVQSANMDTYSFVTQLTEEQLQNLEQVGENWW